MNSNVVIEYRLLFYGKNVQEHFIQNMKVLLDGKFMNRVGKRGKKFHKSSCFFERTPPCKTKENT